MRWASQALEACANSGRHEDARGFYNEMRLKSISPSTRTYGKLMESAAKAGRRKDAERWFQEEQKLRSNSDYGHCTNTRDSTVSETEYTSATRLDECIPYHLLVDAAARAGDFRAAEGWLRRFGECLPQADMQPALNTVMSAAAASGDMKIPHAWLQKMYASTLQPDDTTFIAVAEKCVEAGDLNAAEDWLDQAEPSQRVEATSEVVLNTVRAGRLVEAERLLRQVVGYQFSESLSLAFKEVIRRNLELGNVGEAEAWLEAAHSAGGQADNPQLRKVYLEMLKAAAFSSDLQKAEEVFTKARAMHFCDLQFFTVMVDAAGKCKDLIAAERWFESAIDAGFEPDIVLFTSMVDAACRLGDLRAAEYWQKRAESAGFEANKVMFSTLISGAARKGNKNKALVWAARATDRFGPDIVILNCVVALHAQAGDIGEAEAVLENDILRGRLQPDVRSFGPIINGHAEKGHFEQALQQFRRMVDLHHVPPSVIQYNQLLKACARHRPPLAQEAEKIFAELMAMSAEHTQRKFKTQDVHPTRITLKSLGRCVGARRLSEMCKAGSRTVHTDYILFLSMVKADFNNYFVAAFKQANSTRYRKFV